MKNKIILVLIIFFFLSTLTQHSTIAMNNNDRSITPNADYSIYKWDETIGSTAQDEVLIYRSVAEVNLQLIIYKQQIYLDIYIYLYYNHSDGTHILLNTYHDVYNGFSNPSGAAMFYTFFRNTYKTGNFFYNASIGSSKLAPLSMNNMNNLIIDQSGIDIALSPTKTGTTLTYSGFIYSAALNYTQDLTLELEIIDLVSDGDTFKWVSFSSGQQTISMYNFTYQAVTISTNWGDASHNFLFRKYLMKVYNVFEINETKYDSYNPVIASPLITEIDEDLDSQLDGILIDFTIPIEFYRDAGYGMTLQANITSETQEIIVTKEKDYSDLSDTHLLIPYIPVTTDNYTIDITVKLANYTEDIILFHNIYSNNTLNGSGERISWLSITPDPHEEDPNCQTTMDFNISFYYSYTSLHQFEAVLEVYNNVNNDADLVSIFFELNGYDEVSIDLPLPVIGFLDEMKLNLTINDLTLGISESYTIELTNSGQNVCNIYPPEVTTSEIPSVTTTTEITDTITTIQTEDPTTSETEVLKTTSLSSTIDSVTDTTSSLPISIYLVVGAFITLTIIRFKRRT